MEVMKEPVTISTGITYERKNIEKWFHIYNQKTCPATMQSIGRLEMTPNHTLKRLIVAWRDAHKAAEVVEPSHSEVATILGTIDTTPFKVTCLRKLRSTVETGDLQKDDFKKLGGVEIIATIITQILVENVDFTTIRACEEALGVLHHVQFSDEEIPQILMSPNFVKSMSVLLQRGSSEAKFLAISTFLKIVKADHDQRRHVAQDQGVDFFKSLLETASDELCTKTSSSSLKLLIEILDRSKKTRLKAIEAGAMSTLIELLPDSKNRARCERIMHLIKLLCECADGRLAFIEHELGIAAVSKKIMNVSNEVTRIGVKILWLMASFHPTQRMVEEMLACGAVKKLVALLHIGGVGGMASTRDRAARMLKLHGGTWRRYGCFPSELKIYLGL